jgi:hypothetical protein
MRVRRIEIEQQMARIQIESQRAQIRIESHRRDMEIQQAAAKMQVNRQAGSLEVDTTAAQENTGHRSAMAQQNYFADRSIQMAQAGVSRRVQDGDIAGQQPQTTDNMMAAVAASHMLEEQVPTVDVSTVPPAISVNATPESFEINWEMQDLEINWEQYQRPNITVEPPPSVEISLAQEARMECKVVDEYIPAQTGQKVDVVG